MNNTQSVKIDIKKAFDKIYYHKLKIVIFTISICLVSIVYFSYFKSSVKVDHRFVIKSSSEFVIPIGIFSNKIRAFQKENQNNFKNTQISFYIYSGTYVFKIISKGKNKSVVLENVDNVLKKFKQVITDQLVIDGNLKLQLLNKELKLINLSTEKLNGIITKLQDKENKKVLMFLNQFKESELNLTTSMKDDLHKINEVTTLIQQFNNILNKYKESNKKIMNEYGKYKKIGDEFTFDDLFQIEKRMEVYEPNKYKFLIMSFLFSIITSVTIILLFFKGRNN